MIRVKVEAVRGNAVAMRGDIKSVLEAIGDLELPE